jgi:hypothetical protein
VSLEDCEEGLVDVILVGHEPNRISCSVSVYE